MVSSPTRVSSKTLQYLVLTAVGALVVFSLGCAAGDVTRWNTQNPAGFWQGLWHGMISIITFIISLFNQNVEIYERFNNGGWYDFGFLLGILIIWGGGGGATARLNKCQRERKRLRALLERKLLEEEDLDEKVERKMRETLKKWFDE